MLALVLAGSLLLVACETHKAEPPTKRAAKTGDAPAPAAQPPAEPPPAQPPAGPEPDCDAVAQQLLALHTRRIDAAPEQARAKMRQEVGQQIAAQKAECVQKGWPADYRRCLAGAADEAALTRCDTLRPAAAAAADADVKAPDCDQLAIKLFQQQRDFVAATIADPKTPAEQKVRIEQQLQDMDKNRAQGIQSLLQQCNQLAWTPALRNCLMQAKDGKEVRACMQTLFKPPAPQPAPDGAAHGPDDGHGH